jgi:hypothetical protein
VIIEGSELVPRNAPDDFWRGVRGDAAEQRLVVHIGDSPVVYPDAAAAKLETAIDLRIGLPWPPLRT